MSPVFSEVASLFIGLFPYAAIPLFMVHNFHNLHYYFNNIYYIPCKVLQDSMRFWIPHCGFQIPSAGLRILPVQIPHSKTQNIPDFSFWFAHNFYIPFSRNDFNGKFHNWRTCYVNACLSIHISITTFDNYKKHITANQGINFSSTNTYWDCPFIPHIFNNSE